MINKIVRNEKIICTFLILLGILLRLYKINSPLADWHSFRQADTASVSRYFLTNGINLLDPRYQDISRVQSGIFNPNGYRLVEFPIYNALHVYFYKIFSFLTFEEAGRMLSVLFTVITSVFLLKIATHYFGKVAGMLTMFIFLTLPFNIYFTRVILPEPLAVMLGIGGLWFFIKYSEKGKTQDLILYSLLMSMGVLVKPYIIFYNVFVLYWFWRNYGIKKMFIQKDAIILSLIIFLPFIFWRFWIMRHPEGIPFWKWTFNGDGVRFKPAFWYWIFGERIGKLILGVWGVYLMLVGILTSKKNNFLITLLLGGFLYVSVIATANVRHDYYQTLLIPPIAIAVALGLEKMIKEGLEDRIKLFIPLSIFCLMILISAFQVKEFYKINHPEIIDAGKAVDRLAPPDALVIASYNGDTAFLYQTKRKGWPVVELPINELIAEGASYLYFRLILMILRHRNL